MRNIDPDLVKSTIIVILLYSTLRFASHWLGASIDYNKKLKELAKDDEIYFYSTIEYTRRINSLENQVDSLLHLTKDLEKHDKNTQSLDKIFPVAVIQKKGENKWQDIW